DKNAAPGYHNDAATGAGADEQFVRAAASQLLRRTHPTRCRRRCHTTGGPRVSTGTGPLADEGRGGAGSGAGARPQGREPGVGAVQRERVPVSPITDYSVSPRRSMMQPSVLHMLSTLVGWVIPILALIAAVISFNAGRVASRSALLAV